VEQSVVNLRGEVFYALEPGAPLDGWRGHDFH